MTKKQTSFKVITWNTAKLSSDYIISTTTFVSLAIVRYLIKDKKWLLLIQLSFSIDCWKIFPVQLQRTRHLTCRKLVTVTALLWLQGEFPSYFVGLIIKGKDRESSANYRKLAVSFILLTTYRWSTWKVKRRSCKCDIGGIGCILGLFSEAWLGSRNVTERFEARRKWNLSLRPISNVQSALKSFKIL